MLYVYSLKGDYKRTISLTNEIKEPKDVMTFSIILNYDKDHLLGYNLATVTFVRELPGRCPYYLINKKMVVANL